jgi:hypothetical protein
MVEKRVRVSKAIQGWFEGSQAWTDEAEGESFMLFKKIREGKPDYEGAVHVRLDENERALLFEWASYCEDANRDLVAQGFGEDRYALAEYNAALGLQRQLRRLEGI